MEQISLGPARASARGIRISPPPYRALMLGVNGAMLLLTVLGPWMTYKPQPFTGEGSPLRQACYFITFAAAMFAVRPLFRPDRLLVIPISLAIALGWCWLSLFWAINPDIALRRLMLTTIVIWTVFLTVNHVGYAQTLFYMRTLLAIALVANFGAVLAFPQFGIHQVADTPDPGLIGSWRGIMLQKNFAGAVCAFTIICFLLDARRVPMPLRVLLIAGAAYFLFRTNSKTSMGMTVAAVVAGLAYLRYNPSYRLLLVPTVVVAIAALVLFTVSHWSALIAPLNDRTAFTGRTQIWPVLLAFTDDHLLTGAGYGSFWNIGQGQGPIFTYSKGWITGMAQGHNGYLDLLVTIGLPGLILVVLATIILPIVRLFASTSAPRSAGALLLALILFCAAHNLTESSLLDRDSIVQTFLMLAVAMTMQITASPRLQLSSSSARPLSVPADA